MLWNANPQYTKENFNCHSRLSCNLAYAERHGTVRKVKLSREEFLALGGMVDFHDRPVPGLIWGYPYEVRGEDS